MPAVLVFAKDRCNRTRRPGPDNDHTIWSFSGPEILGPHNDVGKIVWSLSGPETPGHELTSKKKGKRACPTNFLAGSTFRTSAATVYQTKKERAYLLSKDIEDQQTRNLKLSKYSEVDLQTRSTFCW